MKPEPILYVDSNKDEGVRRLTDPRVLMRGMAEEDFLRSLLKVWLETFPEEVKAFRDDLEIQKRSLYNDKGMSVEGTMALNAVIPYRPYLLVQRWMAANGDPEWWNDTKNKAKFLKVFSLCKIKGQK